MKPETKKYLHKRRQIIKMIEQISAVYEDDDIRVTAKPDFGKVDMLRKRYWLV